MSDLGKYIRQRTDLDNGEIEWAMQIAKRRRLPRGGVFCEMGQDHHELGFLEQGILQFYQISEDGETVVLDFLFPGGFAIALQNAIRAEPASVMIEAVTPCVLSVWSYQTRLAAQSRDRSWGMLEVSLLQEAFLRIHARRQSLMTMSASERYCNLDTVFPRDWRRIPQNLLASYLRVTPQYLSRLKRSGHG